MVERFDVFRSTFEQPFQQLQFEAQPELAKMILALIGRKLLTPEALTTSIKWLQVLQVSILSDETVHPDIKCAFILLTNMIEAISLNKKDPTLLIKTLYAIEAISTEIILAQVDRSD